ncbi:MAG: SMC-Scp complex subunit ScpB [Proteobacteria bacterium]|nr:SMC-Scp complex subunit ScpB [Pseudomonadota bacterium]
MDVKRIIESLLFVSRGPLTLERIKSILHDTDRTVINMEIRSLVEDYKNRNGGFYIAEVAGGYQFRTHPDCKQWVTLLNQPSPLRISRAALETLSIIAYKQPLIRSDIEYIRGVDSGGVIRNLLDLKLIRVLGRKDIPGRPLIYSTSKYFLELFGLNDIKDLPTLNEIEDLVKKQEEPSQGLSGDQEKP